MSIKKLLFLFILLVNKILFFYLHFKIKIRQIFVKLGLKFSTNKMNYFFKTDIKIKNYL
ncbi:hypothetical protein RS022_01440 [Candidatus Phytoplasma rubi]|uniref:Uncharacterized protein n=1 Tax=Candidatus Phytoplasma rubi TaxID=399025 RepID=A0ABY7BUR2_9MOLU|nr:hypothetical protein RS022_01440 [Candidatus Phytoplasma rubi]